MENFEILETRIEDLRKADKKAMLALYVYYLEQEKPTEFTIPLIISNDGKGLISALTLKNCLYAFMYRSCHFWDVVFNKSSDDDGTEFATVTLVKSGVFSLDEFKNFLALSHLKVGTPTKNDVKRESSAKTKAKSDAKKSETTRQLEESVKQWNHDKTKEIMDVVNAKCKLSTKDFNDLQGLILKILER